MSGPEASDETTGRGRSRPGRRALFSDPEATGAPAPDADPVVVLDDLASGRRALFSPEAVVGGAPTRGVSPGWWSGVVHCRTCLQATALSLPELGFSLIPSLWLPTRPWPRLMRCPACRRVAWCRIDWPRLR